MAVSSSCLFHFTKKDSLLSILKSGEFWPSFCPFDHYHNEEYWECSERENTFKVDDQNLFQLPMVSFCDLLLTQIKRHIEDYGENNQGYGIGLYKEWGIANRINPITYLNKTSHIGHGYGEIWRRLKRYSKSLIDDGNQLHDDLGVSYINIGNIIFNSKPYKGYSFKPKGSERVFYDEREWRYIPENDYALAFLEDKLSIDYNAEYDSFKRKSQLKFQPKDISFIIVNGEEEVCEMIELIRTLGLSSNERDLMLTKIQSVESIEQNYGIH